MEAAALLTLPLILFLSLTTNGVSARHGISVVDQPPAVLDSSGNSLLYEHYYYLVPALNFSSWVPTAIFPGVYRENTCWFRVAYGLWIPITGAPVKFSPVTSTEDKVIRESTNMTITFPDELSLVCGGSSVLKVGKFELSRRFLTLGGDKEDQSSWFKIEKASEILVGAYKLVSSKYGRDVGNSTRIDLTMRLALALPLVGSPLPLEFALKTETSNTSF